MSENVPYYDNLIGFTAAVSHASTAEAYELWLKTMAHDLGAIIGEAPGVVPRGEHWTGTQGQIKTLRGKSEEPMSLDQADHVDAVLSLLKLQRGSGKERMALLITHEGILRRLQGD